MQIRMENHYLFTLSIFIDLTIKTTTTTTTTTLRQTSKHLCLKGQDRADGPERCVERIEIEHHLQRQVRDDVHTCAGRSCRVQDVSGYYGNYIYVYYAPHAITTFTRHEVGSYPWSAALT